MMSKLIAWIAALGQSIQFVAFVAHFGIATIIAEHVYTRRPLWTVTGIMVAGAVKEFVFDAKYETNPPQDFWDNLSDWVGWASGGMFGFGFAVGWW